MHVQAFCMTPEVTQLSDSLVQLKGSLESLHSTVKSIQHSGKVDKEQLNILLTDMKAYKITDYEGIVGGNHPFHAGHLYEHSMWVEQVVADWCRKDSKEPWCEGLSKRDKYIVALAGLLHDVGKGGGGKLEYYSKPTHPNDGFNMLIGTKKYVMKNGGSFDFGKLLKNLTSDEKKIFAILVGIHWDFGGTVLSNFKESQGEKNKGFFEQFLNNIKLLASKAGYTKKIDEKLVKQSILIGAADVKGSQPATGPYTIVFDIFNTDIKCLPFHTVSDQFIALHYNTQGPKAREKLLHYFRDVWSKK